MSIAVSLENWGVIFHRGKWMTLTGITNYVFHQGDDWVVSKMLGTTSLGLYQVAYKMSAVLILQVVDIFGQTLFPIYAKIRDDAARLWEAFLRVSIVITLITVTAASLIYFCAEPVITVLLPAEWIPIIPVVKLLAVFGAIRGVTGSVSSLFLAVKKQEYLTYFTMVSMVGMLIVIIPFVRSFGLLGAVWSAIVGSLLAVPVMIWGVYRIFKKRT